MLIHNYEGRKVLDHTMSLSDRQENPNQSENKEMEFKKSVVYFNL